MKSEQHPTQSNRGIDSVREDLIMDSMLRQVIRSDNDENSFITEVTAKVENCEHVDSLHSDALVTRESKTGNKATGLQVARVKLALAATSLAVSCALVVFVANLVFSLQTPPQAKANLPDQDRGVENQKTKSTGQRIADNEEKSVADQTRSSIRKSALGDELNNKFVRRRNAGDEIARTIAEERTGASPAGGVNCLEDILQPDLLDESFAPRRRLDLAVAINKSGYGEFTVNDEKVTRRIGPIELATVLKMLEPEISGRIFILGPRIGSVFGAIHFSSRQRKLKCEYETVDELQSAIGQVNRRLATIQSSYRRGKHERDPVQFCFRAALKETNELFQGWSQDALESGSTAVYTNNEQRLKFRRIIDLKSLRGFARHGNFQLPVPQDLYQPTTTLQSLEPDDLRNQLAISTRQVNIFRNVAEFTAFRDAMVAERNNDVRKVLGPAKEPLEDIVAVRNDLQGLPLVMGKECHMDDERSRALDQVSRTIGPILSRFDFFASRDTGMHPQRRKSMLTTEINRVSSHFPQWSDSAQSLLTVDQMLQIEQPEMRIELVKLLGKSRTKIAASLLACYVKFDLNPDVRIMATHALSMYPAAFYRTKLLEGFEYPWPQAARHSAEALVRLNDVDSLSDVVEFLKSPDPRSPQENAEGHYVKRELVAINHLRNCMLCHADSRSASDRGQAPVPDWDTELPRLYYQARSPGLMARADITYLRQDFSVVQKVENAKPWPTHQRFDYVVQARKLSADEFESLSAEEKIGDITEYRDAVLFVLRMLTDENPSDDSYDTWKSIVDGKLTAP